MDLELTLALRSRVVGLVYLEATKGLAPLHFHGSKFGYLHGRKEHS